MNCHTPASLVHSRTYTGPPVVGRPVTVTVRLSPCEAVYRFDPPAVVPTHSQYSWAPVPAVQLNVTVAPVSVEPGVGLVSCAFGDTAPVGLGDELGARVGD